jgi:hypothetical protein
MGCSQTKLAAVATAEPGATDAPSAPATTEPIGKLRRASLGSSKYSNVRISEATTLDL